ncbi:hypothetical protein AKJ37_05305 [candidate division MSBL1 archaeon SCGC-AAA259I09]|uniref:Uncharacterized protein n=1 Tax=candidate division MSBL1 archaeon SCGC-AAA259I09 TaxID=1698267 RepID=A0A133UQJ3_9EURY|nr:hypothetical protein AKJ37_05305 [candidate division MSBL1 archaeon SCGC-AAA259I09]
MLIAYSSRLSVNGRTLSFSELDVGTVSPLSARRRNAPRGSERPLFPSLPFPLPFSLCEDFEKTEFCGK